MTNTEFAGKEGEKDILSLLRLHSLHMVFCNRMLDSSDQPTRICALLIKCVESYKQRVFGVKKGHTWLLKIQGCNWLGAFKLLGKSNYLTDTLYHEDTLYGEGMFSNELEWKRLNQVMVMTEGSDAMSLDETNELTPY